LHLRRLWAPWTEPAISDVPTPDASHPLSQGLLKALVSAGAVLGVGMLLLGLPGAAVLEIVDGLGLARKLEPDAVWPLAICITFAGAALIVPASLALRYKRPHITGWAHVWRTALLTLAATFLFAWILLR
jgi:hypothetical protein